MECALSGGVLGRWKCAKEGDGVHVPVYFSNPDLLWATDYPAPRFGQGAFAAALRELYQQVLPRMLFASSANPSGPEVLYLDSPMCELQGTCSFF